MRKWVLFLAILSLAFACKSVAADENEKDSSTQLLEQLLRDPVPNAVPQPPQQGMSVKIYQLGNLRVDAPNGLRATEVLRKWLPAGSTVTPVPATNSLHVLTTESAHSALTDLLAALDQPIGTPAPTVDPQLKEAFEHFAANSVDPEAMKKIVKDVVQQNELLLNSAESKISDRLAKDQRRFYVIVGVFAATVILLFCVLLLRTRKKDAPSTALVPVNDRALAAIGQQIQQSSGSLATDVKKVLETALQIQRQSEAQRSAEYASFKTQLEAYLGKHTAVLDDNRLAMERTARHLTESAQSIKASQEKNEKLTDQLRKLLTEVDHLHQELAVRDDKLDAQAEELRRKEEEVANTKSRLAQNMAKLAILAKELGASDEFMNAPLPAYDQFVEGEAAMPPGPVVPPEAKLDATPEESSTLASSTESSQPEQPTSPEEDEAQSIDFKFSDPV